MNMGLAALNEYTRRFLVPTIIVFLLIFLVTLVVMVQRNSKFLQADIDKLTMLEISGSCIARSTLMREKGI